jgi:lysophospholipase L1-like esterase
MSIRQKKWLLAALSIVVLAGIVRSQTPDNIAIFTNYWKSRADLFRKLPIQQGEIVFLGDSITDGCEWAELTGNPKCINRGISGDTSWGLLARLTEVTEGKPAKLFLMIGTNDLARGKPVAEVRDKIVEVLDTLRQGTPVTILYLQSVLPTIESLAPLYTNDRINSLNSELKALAAAKGIAWIDLATPFKDESGKLKTELTDDGLHLNGQGYLLWRSLIRRELP